MEFTLLGAAFVAVIALYVTLYWEARRGNAAGCTHDLWEIAITAGIAGLFVGRIAAMIGDGVNPVTSPADIVIIRGGVATGPAAVGAILTAGWLGRREVWPVLDGLAAGALAGLGGWHAGCLLRDACLGTPSELPWAYSQTGSSVTRHPVEIYAALLLFAAAGLVALWRARGRPAPAMATGVALAAASAIRLVTEPLRPTLGSGPIYWYWLGLLIGLGMVTWAARRGSRDDSDSTPRSRTIG